MILERTLILKVREAAGLDQDQFAKLLGMNSATVRRWEDEENETSDVRGNAGHFIMKLKSVIERQEEHLDIALWMESRGSLYTIYRILQVSFEKPVSPRSYQGED